MNTFKERLIEAAVTGLLARTLPPSDKEGYWAEVRDRAHAAVDMAEMVLAVMEERAKQLESTP